MTGRFDVVVVGSGPAGQKAAVQAAKGGCRVALCEQLRRVGGACVHQGTIPSKALRERALERFRNGRQTGDPLPPGGVAALIGEMGEIVSAHDTYMTDQLQRNGVAIVHGRAGFVDPYTIRVRHTDSSETVFSAAHVVIATGSTPRIPHAVPVDHEFVYDSDSILSLAYLPASLVVLGGGVIACEYASVFALLGVRVTLIDKYPRPLGFLDPDLIEPFLAAFARNGGSFVGGTDVVEVAFDGVSSVHTRLADGRIFESEKVLCALGRVSQLKGLAVDKAGVEVDERGLVVVDEAGRTCVPHIFAAGDVVGPPSLASASMEQGRRAACAILGIDAGRTGEWIPSGIYTIPEMACVGLPEAECRERYGSATVGYAHFREIARGHIAGTLDGMLKLVASPDGILRGVHIVGPNATDLVHIGQMAMIHDATLEVFVENVFNFPTYAESYRVAALNASAVRARSTVGAAVA